MNATKQRFEEIARRIASAAAGSARDVRLVAVSKMQPIEAIVEMYREVCLFVLELF
jgi:uncharacterized pyridoxal phosphate-containing UPF0001 family protein